MREAVFTVSPNRQYLGITCPTTPVQRNAYNTTNIGLHAKLTDNKSNVNERIL